MTSHFEYDHLLHPTTLDSCFQSTFVPTLGDGQKREPTSIDSISLIVNEIRNWVFDVIRSHVTMNYVLSAGSIADLAVKIAEKSLLVPEELRKGRQ